MRVHLSVLVLGLLAGCMGSGGTGVDVVPNQQTSVERSLAAIDANAGGSFEQMLNGVRAVNAAEPLGHNNLLALAAKNHADDMLARGYFAHVSPDGRSTLETRLQAVDYDYRSAGENIAKGYTSEESVMRGWTNSPGHHRNNINPNYQDFGIGKAGSGRDLHWVLVLATPR